MHFPFFFVFINYKKGECRLNLTIFVGEKKTTPQL